MPLFMLLRKIWAWLKSYWYVPMLAIGAIVAYAFFSRESGARMLKLISRTNELRKQETAAIEQAHKEELEAKRAAQEAYDTTMKKLEAERVAGLARIEAEKEARRKELEGKTVEELTNDVAKKIGAAVVKPQQ